FGVDGELFKKRQEIVKPIQDKVYTAIKAVADGGGYAIIFDKSEQSNILYGNERYNKSDDVLKKLGYSVGSK
ncbi:MAG: OmpH family outer membrane protein, partial [Flavobacteriales bacterium]